MGVPGLWRELADFAEDATLADVAWAHWTRTSTLFRLGIDATSWLYHARKSRGGAEPELRLFFFRLVRLLALPIAPLFVLDGAARPSVKRGKPVWLGMHPLEAPFQALVQAFGFAHWRAPAEAEAELAWLSAHGTIDGVLTDDVDALVFGARVVLRHRAASADAPLDTVAVLDTRDATWPYDADALVLVALLAGGDYDAHGCPACGIRTAMTLATSGYGAKLLRQFREHFPPTTSQAQLDASCAPWDTFVAQWRNDMGHELQTNAYGRLARKQPKLAQTLRASAFLGGPRARHWLFDYVWPCTSQRTPRRAQLEQRAAQNVVVSLGALAREAHTLFAWSEPTVLARFERAVWSAAYVRRLLDAAHRTPVDELADAMAALMAGPRRPMVLAVHARRRVGQRDEARVSFEARPFVNEVCQALGMRPLREPCERRVWVPVALLRAQQHGLAHIQADLAAPRHSTPPPRLDAYLETVSKSDDSDVQFIEARLRE
ncbi:hypothetical protein MCAP1_003172 [Malassezia caprae]|uniref:XPG-I domain-containing protein n=1 Tax=Malassezia caprae TaxID=1381934 RepID=A0AAF0IXD5_9BASI|nr:hypothetical protein MCAP1_003172 [Malassezia caprae]